MDFFLGIVTEGFFTDPKCFENLGRAIALDQSIYLIVKADVEVPQRFMAMADRVEIFNAPEDIDVCIEDILYDDSAETT